MVNAALTYKPHVKRCRAVRTDNYHMVYRGLPTNASGGKCRVTALCNHVFGPPNNQVRCRIQISTTESPCLTESS